MTSADAGARVRQAIADLDAWLETMRQPGGYGGPVAHWWQNRYRYAGPGLDWRYEGVLIGYATLLRSDGETRWRARIEAAVDDLLAGQRPAGDLRASRFEINPGPLGTPHEAAALLGLVRAHPHLDAGRAAQVVAAVERGLNNLHTALWDGTGFNDRPGVTGRVPNKLATLAQTLLEFAPLAPDGSDRWLQLARSALDDVLRFQEGGARLGAFFDGAIHQYAAGSGGRVGAGDDRFFPYYNARCVPPLLRGAEQLGEARYREAAERTLGFLDRTLDPDGVAWPQIVYGSGARARWPRWRAGSADTLLAYLEAGRELPAAALERLLASQSPSGGFTTGEGFAAQIGQRTPPREPDYRDVTPVVGWNDKVLRLLTAMAERTATPLQSLPAAAVRAQRCPIRVWGRPARFEETPTLLRILPRDADRPLYEWRKTEPWARIVSTEVNVR